MKAKTKSFDFRHSSSGHLFSAVKDTLYICFGNHSIHMRRGKSTCLLRHLNTLLVMYLNQAL